MRVRVPEIVIGFLAAIALLCFIGYVFTNFLHDFKTSDAVNVALVAATIALCISTQKLVIGAEQTSERQLRAYLNVDAAEFHANNSSGGCHATVRFKNYGQTPAYDCHGWLKFDCNITGSPFSYSRPASIKTTGHHITAPGLHYDMTDRGLQGYSIEQIKMLSKGVTEVVVYGEITYTDIFRKTRSTKFRYIVGGRYGIPTTPSTFTHEEGNEAT